MVPPTFGEDKVVKIFETEIGILKFVPPQFGIPNIQILSVMKLPSLSEYCARLNLSYNMQKQHFFYIL